MLKLLRLCFFLVLLAPMPSGAESLPPSLPPIAGPDISSPSATIRSFQQGAAAIAQAYKQYRRAKTEERRQELLRAYSFTRETLDLSDVPPAGRVEAGSASVIFLMDILARLPAIDPATIPGGNQGAVEPLPERWRIPDTSIIIARIAEGDYKDQYLFSAKTVSRLHDLHAAIIDKPTVNPVLYQNWQREHRMFTGPVFSYDLMRRIPNAVQTPVLGTPAWKLKLALLLHVLSLIALVIIARLLLGVSRRCGNVSRYLVQLAAPIGIGVVTALVHRFIVTEVNLSGAFGAGEILFTSILIYMAVAWAIWLACYMLVEIIIATPLVPEGSYDAHLLRLVAKVTSVAGVTIVFIYGANELGVPLLGIIAGMGVGGFALALAAQSTVENLFGGVSIFADKPFRVGQFIQFGNDSGVVEAVGPRSARIRGTDGTLMTVPNSDLAKMHITNFSMRDKYLMRHVIGLRYETSPEQFAWLLADLRQKFETHPLVEQTASMPRIRMNGFGASSIDVEIRASILTTNVTEFAAIQEELILSIMKSVEAAGTGFAFPSQTAYLAKDTGLDQEVKAQVEAEIRSGEKQPPTG